MSKLFGIILIVLFSVTPTFALIISEIVANPDGTDTGCEIIEIYNEEDKDYDIKDISLYDGGTLRELKTGNSDTMILTKEYVLFLQNDYPTKNCTNPTTGKYFFSNFQLANTKDSLILKLKNDIELDNFKFDRDGLEGTKIEAKEGSSLSKIDNVIKESKITLGKFNEIYNTTTTTTSNSNSTTTTETTPTFSQPTYYNRYYFPESEKIYLNIGDNKIGAVGANILFEGITVNGDKKTVNANYFWSFGDGQTSEGKNTSHTYKYPGEYTIDGEAYANGYKANARIYIKVVEPNLKIKLKVDEYVEITNLSKEEADIGGFFINDKTLPKKLSILPSKSIKISSETLQLATGTQKVVLKFANGKEIVSDEVFLSDHELNKIQDEVKINSTSSTNVTVYTKEQFENLQKKPKPIMLKNEVKKFVYKTQELKQFDNHNEKVQENFTKEKFIVKNENKGMLKNILNYFGI